MKEAAEAVISFIAAVLLAIFFFTFLFFFAQFCLCFGAAKKLSDVNMCPIMRLIVYGSSSEKDTPTVSARISLLDLDSTEIAVIERSWNGESLSVSFLSASFSGKTVWFPFCIYCNDFLTQDYVPGRKGTKLSQYYSENSLCYLYSSSSCIFEKNQRNLNQLLRYALISRFRPFSRFSNHRMISLAECERGESYTIYSGFEGHLFLLKD